MQPRPTDQSHSIVCNSIGEFNERTTRQKQQIGETFWAKVTADPALEDVKAGATLARRFKQDHARNLGTASGQFASVITQRKIPDRGLRSIRERGSHRACIHRILSNATNFFSTALELEKLQER
jgi:hypothetical protein